MSANRYDTIPHSKARHNCIVVHQFQQYPGGPKLDSNLSRPLLITQQSFPDSESAAAPNSQSQYRPKSSDSLYIATEFLCF
ncbi:hypothetical protein MJO29_007390 [Puccinia striiformis f. sp. tritici]|uniref:hypothetical protein n=1 Tax=Puccinia striiformis f. sp. tritici TaxID=168172 RepID=UPI00200876D0|nr:hypothetical protein Pst134EA_013557 [Puccinia striiformis f. sp. tritici]KAI9603942.1 hypothetical protein H4Q26_003551 [Puccinia striiformis f. sp. tritici PST-130]KAH9454467.1 hypothetical protein Pst134EB_014549 [Puccinia striiformis f. sp. tritici]KAH9465677.1 hypothetical protein Pst134EA_013557 [Puccinia striiformis f. sp. tritici]KAI7955991.1 hypothetical protein MJO29_007390 [Puccinia striiformis f. sp. tritici]KAI9612373.1 hypothetical protein KEM48_004104 [Puccinia striiformis f.